MDKSTILAITDIHLTEADLRTLVDGLDPDAIHVSVLVTASSAPLPLLAHGSPPYGPIVFPEDWIARFTDDSGILASRAASLREVLRGAGFEGDVTTALDEPSALGETVARRAAFCDLALLGVRDRQTLLSPLLFHGAGGVVLNARRAKTALAPPHAAIAWDGSMPALRAIHRALPILTRSKAVTILRIEEPGVDSGPADASMPELQAWLERHGCTVAVERPEMDPDGIAATLLGRSRELGVDLLVMGAFARSRARQFLLGGTTRSITRQEALPILLSH